MRFILIIFLCAVSFSASAQLFHISLHKKHEVLPYIKSVKDNSVSRIVIMPKSARTDVRMIYLGQSQYFNEMAAASAMRSAKHNMSWRLYNEASYNFSDLAQCYIKLNRFSEAKWYLLQSIKISREENDDKHTISNLISLAVIKTNVGDVPSARADLVEARDLATAKGMQAQATEIDKKIVFIDRNTATVVKPDVKYAETSAGEKKAL